MLVKCEDLVVVSGGVEPPTFRWSENRPWLGARQHTVARQRLRVLGAVVSWPR